MPEVVDADAADLGAPAERVEPPPRLPRTSHANVPQLRAYRNERMGGGRGSGSPWRGVGTYSWRCRGTTDQDPGRYSRHAEGQITAASRGVRQDQACGPHTRGGGG